VIVLTGTIEVDTAVQCMKIGAMDYVVKPVEEDRLIAAVKQALAMEETGKKPLHQDLFAQIKNPAAFRHIITQDKKMHAIFHYVEAIAPSLQPVLICGETGVGKELIGQCIHVLSGRNGKLVVVNAAGLDDNVFSDTLFGHVPGAFTGADKARPGLIEQAAGGTLFLDEIGDLAMTSQVKLLRLLQEGDYLALGSDRIRHSDARIIAATNQDLWALEKQGKFRKDLIYRLSTHTLTLPPLRERLLDLPLLLDRFVCQAAVELNKPIPDIPKTLIEQMESYPFKGNIRELKSMVHDALTRYEEGPITTGLFKDSIRTGSPTGSPMPIPRYWNRTRDLPTLKAGIQHPGGKSHEESRGQSVCRRQNTGYLPAGTEQTAPENKNNSQTLTNSLTNNGLYPDNPTICKMCHLPQPGL
jgi:DNA-binding NtrC family response regulator